MAEKISPRQPGKSMVLSTKLVGCQAYRLSLASLRDRLIDYQLGWGKGGNVTSAGWQVTLCDPVWHVSSRSGVATLRTAIHLLLTYLLVYHTYDSSWLDARSLLHVDGRCNPITSTCSAFCCNLFLQLCSR